MNNSYAPRFFFAKPSYSFFYINFLKLFINNNEGVHIKLGGFLTYCDCYLMFEVNNLYQKIIKSMSQQQLTEIKEMFPCESDTCRRNVDELIKDAVHQIGKDEVIELRDQWKLLS